ncbi:hypothetical protein, partial, partial [Parasitella parasitica]
MFSAENQFTPEQSEALNSFLGQFQALQESIPHQLEALQRNQDPGPSTEVPATQDSIMPPMLKVKEPMIFSGKPSQRHFFFSQLTLVFVFNPSGFASDKNKILYAISYMQGVVLSYMEPCLEEIDSGNPPSIITNFEVFKDTIIKGFGDSNPVINAEQAIRSLKQTGPVAVYATEFRRLSMLLKWNDVGLMSQVKLNPKDFIIKELARRPAVKTLAELMSSAIEIDNLFFAVQKQSSNSNHSRNHNSFKPQQNNHSNNQKSSNHYKTYQRIHQFRPQHHIHNNRMNSNNTPSLSNNHTPMELGAINSYKPLSATVKKFRKRNNLCLYCGESGHINTHCFNKGRKPPISINALTAINEERNFVNRPRHSGKAVRPAGKRKLYYDMVAATSKNTTTSSHDSLFVLPVTVNEFHDDKTEALIDTGAADNFISLRLVDEMSLHFTMCKPEDQTKFRLANNE